MTKLALPLLAILLISTMPTAHASDEVRVLRGRRQLTGLSGTGAGGVIERALVTVDLRVASLSYEKRVGVRWTADGWKTWNDATAHWVRNFEDGSEHWAVELDLGTVGRNVVVNGQRGDMGPAWIQLAAYAEMQGRTFWDSDGGRDHAVSLLGPSAGALPEARFAPRTAIANGVLYLVGGQESEAYRFTVPSVLRLDPSSREWTKVADLPAIPAVGGAGAPSSPQILVGYEVAAVSGGLHVMGGTNLKVGGYPRENLRLDLATGSWKTCAELPGPLIQRRAVVLGDEVHLVPTTRNRPPYPGDSNDAFVYDAKKDAWTKVAIAGLDLLAQASYVTVPCEDRLYFFAGLDALVYHAKTRSIARLASPPVAIDGGAKGSSLTSSQIVLANVAADPARGSAAALVLDVLAGNWTKLADRPFFGFDATLAQAPPALISSGGAPGKSVASLLVFTGTSRVDSFEPLGNVVARGESRTVIRVRADVGAGHSVSLRGSSWPLAWDRGSGCRWTAGNVWVFETTDLIDEGFRFKPLVDDRVWRAGDDVRVRPGETVTVEGLFASP